MPAYIPRGSFHLNLITQKLHLWRLEESCGGGGRPHPFDKCSSAEAQIELRAAAKWQESDNCIINWKRFKPGSMRIIKKSVTLAVVLFGIFSTWLTSRDDKRHGNRQRLNSRADNGLCPNAAAKPKPKLRLRAKWRGSSRHTHTNYGDYQQLAIGKRVFRAN